MNKLLRNLFIFILIIVFIVAFSSSHFSLSIDNLAYVLAIAVDKVDQNTLQVTFQFSVATPVSESGSSEKNPYFTNSVTASSLSTAINLMDGYMGKQLNLSHCKVIVFSEELASDGLSNHIYTLINDTQIRPSANILVSKCSAKQYLENVEPDFETLVAKYYEIFTNSSKYTGLLPDATIGDFFNRLICQTCEPFAMLGGLSAENSDIQNIGDPQNNYSVKSNESSLIGKNGSENIGVAVFKDDKLVGELNAIETISLLSIRNDLNEFLISIPDPLNENQYLDIYLTPTASTDVKVDTSNGSPYIKVKFRFAGRIYSMAENSKYLEPDVLEEISNACNSYLESIFSDYLYKTSKEFKSDINGFGKSALTNFFTTQDFENYDWLENYKDAFFDVSVDTLVKSGMLITET